MLVIPTKDISKYFSFYNSINNITMSNNLGPNTLLFECEQ